MTPAKILEELEKNDQLRRFIVGFHNYLALDNPHRQMGILTDNERAMNALGRLLVGDEVCAAIAADGNTVFVSSNSANHSHSQISLLIHRFIYTANADGTQVRVTANATIGILLDDGNTTKSLDKSFEIGEYTYDTATRKLTPNTTAQPKCEITADEHDIGAYPYPVAWLLQPLPEITIPADELTAGSVMSSPFQTPVPMITRLDPLFRRSVSVLSHLGLLCLLSENKKVVDAADKHIKLNRIYVMKQSLTWEAAKFYNLNKAMHRFSVPKNERDAHNVKMSQKATLEEFIERLTFDLNKSADQKETLTEWKKNFLAKIDKVDVPAFIRDSQRMPIDRFLELITIYFGELILLERHFRTCTPDRLTQTLALIGRKERLGHRNDASLQIVDANLSAGTHAEVRLFHHFMAEKKDLKKLYFGITQLCCACCNTLFKAHGLLYSGGSVNRAGTHGTHYPGWKFDSALRTDAIMEPFLGRKLFHRFKSLGELRDSACDIIQDLASLWYQPTPDQSEKIRLLGFTHQAIACDESHYPDLDPSTVARWRNFSDTVSRFGLAIDRVPGDGNCQFRSVARALRSLDENILHAETLGSGGDAGSFTILPSDQENVFTESLRSRTAEHIRTHSATFTPFLVTEDGREFATVADFADHLLEPGVFGNELSLQALAAVCTKSIIILRPGTAAKPVQVHVTPPQPNANVNINEAIIITYNGEDHYDAVLYTLHHSFDEEFCELVKNSYEGTVNHS